MTLVDIVYTGRLNVHSSSKNDISQTLQLSFR